MSTAIEQALRSFEEHLNAGDYDSALLFYANDERFKAYEDGALQYGSWAEIRDVYSQLPSFGKGRFVYGDLDIEVTDASHAWLGTTFQTSFGEPDTSSYFAFSGVISALLERTQDGTWQMLKIHSSSTQADGRGR